MMQQIPLRNSVTLLLFFFCAGFQLRAQLMPSHDPSNLMVTDLHGNSEPITALSVQDGYERGGGNSCVAGYFNLVFTDDPGTGFNDADAGLAAQLQATACKVFEDLSVLIVPATDPYLNTLTVPLVNIEISASGPWGPGEVGRGSSWNSLITNFMTDWPLLRGIADGQVWRTINGGYDAWYAERMIINQPFQPTFFHGYVRINFGAFPATPAWWHIDGSAPPVAPPFDLYTVLTHEAMHALGFLSYITELGFSSNFGLLYSRFDSHVQAPGGTGYLTSPWSCNNLNFTGADLTSSCSTPPGPVVFTGASAGSLSLFSPDIWNQGGGSLSHLDFTCEGQALLMGPGNPPVVQNRIPSQNEVNILCDIDYHTTDNYGTDPLWIGTVASELDECGHRIAGVDDIHPFGTTEFYVCSENGSIQINDFLMNDEDELAASGTPTDYECPIVLFPWGMNSGSVTYVNSSTVEYIPALDYVGLAVLRYRPICTSDGRLGNFTYIYIKIEPEEVCSSFGCNILNGGDFENVTLEFNSFFNALTPYSDLQLPTDDPQYQNNNSPDPIGWDGSSWISPQLLSLWCAGTPTAFPPSHNGLPNARYVGLATSRNGAGTITNDESIMLNLCLDLIPGLDYELNFWAMDLCESGSTVEFYFLPERPCTPTISTTDVTGGVNTCGGTAFNVQGTLTQELSGATWINYTVPFTFPLTSLPSDWLVVSTSLPLLSGSSTYVLLDDIQIRPNITTTATITPSCNGQNDGAISLDIHYYPDSYTVEWAHGPTTESLTDLPPGTYTVTITDTELGCATLVEEYVVGAADCDGPFSIAKWVTPNDPPNTYAGAPVMFTIQACNNDVVDHVVEITDDLPADFVLAYNNPNNPYSPTATITIPAGGCVTTEITGYFTQIGPHTNEVTLEQEPGVSLSADANITLLDGCPMIVYGNGGCEPGQIVDMCLGMHTQLTDVESVVYYMVYPDFLVPPPPGLLNVGTTITAPPSIQPSISTATIGGPIPLAWVPGYSAVLVEVFFNPPVSPSPPYQFFCIDFTIGTAGVPAGTNAVWTWASTTAPSNSGWNRVSVNTTGGSMDLWTQAYHILFTSCPDIVPPNAEFTVDVPNCGGAVTVTADLNDPDAIHIWTWGDDRTTPINGAPSWTYDYFGPITDNQGWPVNIPPADPGTYTITHTVVLNGVAHSSTQEITIYECCQATTVIPHGSHASVVGDYFSGTVAIHGTFMVDDDVLFQNATVTMAPGAEIIVQNGRTLDILGSSFTACDGIMWKTITAGDGAAVRIRNSFVDDAENVVTGLDGSVIWLRDNQFHNNRVTIYVPAVSGVPWNNVSVYTANNTFYSAGPMALPYQGQTTAVGQRGYAAAHVANMTLDFTGGNNLLHTLSNGIVTDRCDVAVRGCSMLNIQPDAAYAHHANGTGIYARGHKGWFSLKQEGYGMNGTPSFQNCRWGIYTEYMNVHSIQNHMVDMGTAYRVDRSGYRHVDILENRVYTRYNGIDLRANDGAAHILVQNNEITFGDDPACTACRGYHAIHVTEGNMSNTSSRILHNTVHFLPQHASRWGIGLFAADDWLVAENTVHMAHNAFSMTGIGLQGCRRAEVSCNTVAGLLGTFSLDGQSAIRNVMGSEPLISCNDVHNTASGILFSGAAYGTEVRGNKLRHHKWALHLDNSAIIDAQVLKGNLWYESPASGGLGAWYENTFNAGAYPFLYNPATIGGGNTEPPSWSPSNWFVTDPGQNYLCDDGMEHYCNQFDDSRCTRCLRAIDERIATDSLENNPYTDETRWILKCELYAKLDEAPELRDDDPLLAGFYDDLQGSITAALKGIDDWQKHLHDMDSTLAAQLRLNAQQIEGQMALVEEAMEQLGDTTLTPAQQQAILGTVGGYRQAINGLVAYNTTALQLATDTKVLTADNVKAANAALGTTELIETNQKQVNEIHLATIGKDVDTFTPEQAAELFAVANQCPMIGGNAVFKARSLYWLLDDTQDFDDPLLCLPHGIIVKSMMEHTLHAVTVVPNPASGEAALVLTEELKEPVVFIVYNTMGAEVMRHTVPAHTSRFTFNTSALAPAMYHYRVDSPSGIIGDGKLSIIR